MSDIDYAGFSKKLKAIRIEKEITQENIATKLNMSTNTYMSYENDPATIKLSVLLAMGDILDVDIISIFLKYRATKCSE